MKELEVAGVVAGLKPNDQAASNADHMAMNVHRLKVEDQLSMGSAVADRDGLRTWWIAAASPTFLRVTTV